MIERREFLKLLGLGSAGLAVSQLPLVNTLAQIASPNPIPPRLPPIGEMWYRVEVRMVGEDVWRLMNEGPEPSYVLRSEDFPRKWDGLDHEVRITKIYNDGSANPPTSDYHRDFVVS